MKLNFYTFFIIVDQQLAIDQRNEPIQGKQKKQTYYVTPSFFFFENTFWKQPGAYINPRDLAIVVDDIVTNVDTTNMVETPKDNPIQLNCLTPVEALIAFENHNLRNAFHIAAYHSSTKVTN